MYRRRKAGVCSLLASLLVLGATVAAQTGEWPQFGGPTRDFKSDVKGLAPSWPESGPRRLWSRPLGDGYASIVVDNGTLYTMYRTGAQEVVVALEAATGRTIWEYAYDAPFIVAGRDAEIIKEYRPDKGLGPASTPLIVGDRIFAVGATSKFHALDKRTGKLLWEHGLTTELQGFVRERGYSPSPLAYKNTVILPIGAIGASVVAFNQADGSIVWKRHDFKHAYASPLIINVDGQEQFVSLGKFEVIGLDPNNGDLLWSHLAKGTGIGTYVSMPLWGDGNLLFISAGYGLASHAFKLTRSGDKTNVEEVWSNVKVRFEHTNGMRIGDVIYGCSGDLGPSFFTALNARTGEILWQDRRLAKPSFLYADGRFIMMDEEGKLVLAEPTDKGLTIISQVELLQSNAETVPTLVGKTLYVRDRKTIMALDLS